MTRKIEGGVKGVDHVAYVTFKPEETIHFYRDILGFPMVHCILAPAWGNEPQPDFVHFFFDVGNGDSIAFFWFKDAPEAVPGISAPMALPGEASRATSFIRRPVPASMPLEHSTRSRGGVARPDSTLPRTCAGVTTSTVSIAVKSPRLPVARMVGARLAEGR